MKYSFSKAKIKKKGRIYKETLGRPRKKTPQEGPTQELIRKRQNLCLEDIVIYAEKEKTSDFLSPLWGTSIGLLRLYGVLSLREYKTAEWFRGLVDQWRVYAECPRYVVSKFSPVLEEKKPYQKRETFLNSHEEEKAEKIKRTLFCVIRLLQKENPLLYKVLIEIIIDDHLEKAVQLALLKRAKRSGKESASQEEQRAKCLLRRLKEGLFILEKNFLGKRP